MATAEERKRQENRWAAGTRGKNGPMNQREDYAEAIKIKERLQEEEAEGPRQTSTSVNKYDNEQISRSLGSAKDLNVLTQRLAGSGTHRIHQQVHLHRGGNHHTDGGRHGFRMNSEFFFEKKQLQAVSLSGNGDSLVSDGVCKHYTNPTHMSHCSTREFSRVAQGNILCLSKIVIFTSSTPRLMRNRCCSRFT